MKNEVMWKPIDSSDSVRAVYECTSKTCVNYGGTTCRPLVSACGSGPPVCPECDDRMLLLKIEEQHTCGDNPDGANVELSDILSVLSTRICTEMKPLLYTDFARIAFCEAAPSEICSIIEMVADKVRGVCMDMGLINAVPVALIYALANRILAKQLVEKSDRDIKALVCDIASDRGYKLRCPIKYESNVQLSDTTEQSTKEKDTAKSD